MRSSEIKSALILTLLVMILMRLVWMDLRSYVITYAPQNRYAFDRSEVSGSCRRSFSLRQIGPDRPVQGSWERPGWADAWIYQGLVLASCRNGVFHDAGFVRYNQGLLIASLMLCVLLTRIIGRSWIVGLVVAVALLSRGRLISSNGQISGDALLGLGLSAWAMLIAHWLRSGSIWILLLSYVMVGALMSLEPSFVFIGLAPPLLLAVWRPIIYRKQLRDQERAATPLLRKDKQDLGVRELRFWHRWGKFLNLSLAQSSNPALQGNLLRPQPDGLRSLIGLSGYRRISRTMIFAGFSLIGIVFLVQCIVGKYTRPSVHISAASLLTWLELYLSPLDRDFGLSLSMMLLALTWRSRWLPTLRPLLNTVGLAIILASLGALVLDLLYLPREASRLWQGPHMLLLWEPVLMTLGMMAFYQMLLSLLARFNWRKLFKYFTKH